MTETTSEWGQELDVGLSKAQHNLLRQSVKVLVSTWLNLLKHEVLLNIEIGNCQGPVVERPVCANPELTI